MHSEILNFHRETEFIYEADGFKLDITNISSKIVKVLVSKESQIIDDERGLVKSDLTVKLTRDNNFEFAYQNQVFLSGLPHRHFEFDQDSGFNHYLKHTTEHYYGLGEKTGSGLALNQNSYKIATADPMGFNSEKTDPLYKHLPYYIGILGDGRAYGVYYKTMGLAQIDFGREIDALWGSFTSFKTSSTNLEYYVIYGPSVQNVMEGFSFLLGKPGLMPKYAFGYLASAMGYAEADNAQEILENFPKKLTEFQVPCDLLHLSSGYTVDPITGQRNVFTWNCNRFPNPKRLFQILKDNGIKTVANVKPWLLGAHPMRKRAIEEHCLVWNGNNPSECRLWAAGAGSSANGSYIDFLGQQGRSFWKQEIHKLLELGIDGIWNDNNEFSTISNDNWQVGDWNSSTNSKSQTIGQLGRAMLTYLMTTASYEAIQDHQPGKRPFLITRSASTGCHVFASSWGGDNFTSWHTLKHNIPLGLHAGLSLYPNYGHDIGGFAGPRPDPELFLRWVHAGIYQPRFCIHSWKEDGVSEVWMHKEVTSLVRDAIVFRYKLIPYLYHLSLEAHLHGFPIIRPLLYHFQQDKNTYDQGFEYMLGDFLLVASVYEPNATGRTLYLPANRRFFDVFNQNWFGGGQTVNVNAPLDKPGVLFALDGAIIPLNPQARMNTMVDDERDLSIFPDPIHEGQSKYTILDDDGDSVISKLFLIDVNMKWNETRIDLEVNFEDRGWKPSYKFIKVTCGDLNDTRPIYINGNRTQIQFDQPKLFYKHFKFLNLKLSERILMNYDLVEEDNESEGSIDSIEDTVQEDDPEAGDNGGVFPEEFDEAQATINLIREATELFIDGKWDSFDYSALERSDKYIDFKQLELDEQEAYFDEE